MSIFDDEPSHTCPEGIVCCDHAHAEKDSNQTDLESLLEQAKTACLAGESDDDIFTLVEKIYCVTNIGNFHPAIITSGLYPSAWSLLCWLAENADEDKIEAHDGNLRELGRLIDIGFCRTIGVQSLGQVFWYRGLTEEEKEAAIIPVVPVGTKFDGLGLARQESAPYTVKTHLRISTQDGSALPDLLRNSLFTDVDKFSFTRLLPLALGTGTDPETAADDLWGCRWDAFTVWADDSVSSTLGLTLETVSFPYKWILALSGAFPDLVLEGDYRVDVDENHPAYWAEEFVLSGGYNIWAEEEVMI